MAERSLIVVAAAIAAASAPTARAGIVDSTANVSLISAPDSVTLNALESDSHVRIFQEQMSRLLETDVQVDVADPGFYGWPENPPPGGEVAAGSIVDSYLVHFDAVGEAVGNLVNLNGSITFDQPVLGIITSVGRLDASDAVLGLSSTLYPTGETVRRLEIDGEFTAWDTISLTDNGNGTWTVGFDLRVRPAFSDQFRIVLNPVPGPGAAALLGLAGLTARSRRRRTP